MGILKFINMMAGGGGSTPYEPSNLARIFIVSGQSNAVGQFPDGHVMDSFPSQYLGAQSHIKVFWEGAEGEDRDPGYFESMEVPVNTRDKIYTDPENTYYNQTGWGVEQRLMHSIQSRLHTDVYLIKNAIGAMSIGAWNYPTGPLWIQLARMVQDAKAELVAAGKEVVFGGFIWLQGESDKDAGDDVYVGFLRIFLDHLRNDITAGLENMPAYLVKLVPGTTLYDSEINQAFDTMASEDPDLNFVINTEDIPGIGTIDNVHYNAASLLSIGETVYNAMVANGHI